MLFIITGMAGEIATKAKELFKAKNLKTIGKSEIEHPTRTWTNKVELPNIKEAKWDYEYEINEKTVRLSKSSFIDAINDEWDTISRYNSIIATIRDMLENDIDNVEGATAGDLQSTIDIIEDINNAENNHVGMLQSALAMFSENVETIKDGEQEADGYIAKDDGEFADDDFGMKLKIDED
jgi:hypothetical protein